MGSDKQFKHWLTTFKNFVSTIKPPTPDPTQASATNDPAAAVSTPDPKLNTLINYVSASVFEYIADAATYDVAIQTLTDIYIKPVNSIYARHKLATRKQATSESLDSFIQDLHRLSKDCAFEAVNAENHRQGYVRDAFISGIASKETRQKLLENVSLTMDECFNQARTLHTAHQNAASYNAGSQFCASTYYHQPQVETFIESHGRPAQHETHGGQVYTETHGGQGHLETYGGQIHNSESHGGMLAATNQTCWFCGGTRHARSQCPAKNHKCQLCGKSNHWERVCRNSRKLATPAPTTRPKANPQSAAIWPTLATTSPMPPSSSSSSTAPKEGKTDAFCNIKIKKHSTRALIDSGSLSWSFISQDFATRLGLFIIPSVNAPQVSMANSSLTTKNRR